VIRVRGQVVHKDSTGTHTYKTDVTLPSIITRTSNGYLIDPAPKAVPSGVVNGVTALGVSSMPTSLGLMPDGEDFVTAGFIALCAKAKTCMAPEIGLVVDEPDRMSGSSARLNRAEVDNAMDNDAAVTVTSRSGSQERHGTTNITTGTASIELAFPARSSD
jgi:hypothetical protein